MKCFNHENRDAVATCQRCGKALCKECASKYSPCLCEECANAVKQDEIAQAQNLAYNNKMKRLNLLYTYRKFFLKQIIIGIIISLILFFFAEPATWQLCTIGFCVPFGVYSVFFVQMNSAFFQNIRVPDGTESTKTTIFILDIISVVIGSIIGVFAFVYQTYKIYINEKEIKQLRQEDYRQSNSLMR